MGGPILGGHQVNNPIGFMTGCGIERPAYKPGDILYVKETWCPLVPAHIITERYVYKANATLISEEVRQEYLRAGLPYRWRSPIFMPRAAARIFLRVTDVRVERLQEITEADAKAEGITRIFDHLSKEEYDAWNERVHAYSGVPLEPPQEEQPFTNYLWHGNFGKHGLGNKQSDAWPYQRSGYNSARDSFSSLWQMINGTRKGGIFAWDRNPWVWVYTFEPIGKEVAEREDAA